MPAGLPPLLPPLPPWAHSAAAAAAGDANLPKDKFLKKQIAADPEHEGWVPLDIVAGFTKMKSLKADAAAIVAALAGSELLAVSEDATRVRRTQPLPAADTSGPRTVVAQGLTMEPTIEALAAAFSACGEVKLIRAVQPEAQQAGEWANCKHHAFRGTEVLAVIEYATEAEACNACEKLDESKNSWRGGGMGVTLLQKGSEFKSREAVKRQQERNERERRKEETLAAKPLVSQKSTGLSRLVALGDQTQTEGTQPPRERPRLKLAKRGASTAVVQHKTVTKPVSGSDAVVQVEVPLLLAAGPPRESECPEGVYFSSRGFKLKRTGTGRTDLPLTLGLVTDGVERRIDPSDGVAYTCDDFDAAYGLGAGLPAENAEELWRAAGQLMRAARSGGGEAAEATHTRFS